TNMGKTNIIIGYNWLNQHNPDVDWWTGQILFNQCPHSCYNWRSTKPQTKFTPRWQSPLDHKILSKK
ncbi:hypothetical protein L210DRAFT_3401335, partial [Boletus edulis BED1]